MINPLVWYALVGASFAALSATHALSLAQLALLGVIVSLVYAALLHALVTSELRTFAGREAELAERERALNDRETPEYLAKLEEQLQEWRARACEQETRKLELSGELAKTGEKYQLLSEMLLLNPGMELVVPRREYTDDVMSDLQALINRTGRGRLERLKAKPESGEIRDPQQMN